MQPVGGVPAYVTGDVSSPNVIVCIYDIFGLWATTEQGADLLGEVTKSKVIMPDFLRENPWPVDAFPPRNDEEKKKFGEWLDTVGNFERATKELTAVIDASKAQGAQKIALYGTCWGGKLATELAGKASPYVAVASVHPAFISPEDAQKVEVPIAFFPSRDEPKADMDAFWATLEKAHPAVFAKSEFKHYEHNHHGFAAARADLNDKTNYDAFQDVYQRLARFFCEAFK